MSWGTNSEIEFLKNIGRSETGRNQSIQEQIVVLKGYIAGSENRKWGTINGHKCLDFARQRIEALEYIQMQDTSGNC